MTAVKCNCGKMYLDGPKEFFLLDKFAHSELNCIPVDFYDERMTRGDSVEQPEGER
jgi:hypothetical protein